MRLSFADANLATIDSLAGADATCLFIFEDERPLRGAAGHIDWRLCGSLSRILVDGNFVGATGDALLFPVPGRLAACERLFCFGAGRRSTLNKAAFESLARKACQALTLAGARSFAMDLPEVAGLDDAGRARSFLSEAAPHFKGERIILVGDAKALAKAFQQVGGDMKALELDKEPIGTAAPVVASTPSVAPFKSAGPTRAARS